VSGEAPGTTSDLWRLEAGRARDLVARRDLSAVDLAAAVIARLEETEPLLNAYTGLRLERAMDEARALDRALEGGAEAGPLAGVPVAVKDNICLAGLPTTCGSRHLADYQPPEDATVVRRLRRAGAVLLGKTNLDEFAMGSSTEHSAFGPVRNPWDPARVPGGSSGGSAAAVAAGSALAALGSDTGGSVRQPAALCGVVGLRPTYGAVSRSGLVSLASSLDQVGPLARSVRDCALIHRVIAGRDPRDSSSVEPPPAGDAAPGIGGLRIGVPRGRGAGTTDAEVGRCFEDALVRLRSLGAEVLDIELPHQAFGVAVYAFTTAAEAASNLGRYDGIRFGERFGEARGLEGLYRETRSRGFGPEVKRRVLLGTHALCAGYVEQSYVQAQKVRTMMLDEYRRAFAAVDVVCCPTAATPAFQLGERTEDPLTMYRSDEFTVCSSLAGLPSISVPCGLAGGTLPTGLQFTGPAHAEELLFRVAGAYEAAAGYRNMVAPLTVGEGT
jgi:aspartyl-tRNA(Asn)/glutamyl-tRNA(Gln) amidotransferase subunit A